MFCEHLLGQNLPLEECFVDIYKPCFMGLDKQKFSAYNCEYFLTHQF